jgi:MFS family permease
MFVFISILFASCYLSVIGCLMLVTVHDLEKRFPGASGPNGGYSRAISICSMAFTIGSFLGPILSGLITDRIGYFEMSCSLGEYNAAVLILPTTADLI